MHIVYLTIRQWKIHFLGNIEQTLTVFNVVNSNFNCVATYSFQHKELLFAKIFTFSTALNLHLPQKINFMNGFIFFFPISYFAIPNLLKKSLKSSESRTRLSLLQTTSHAKPIISGASKDMSLLTCLTISNSIIRFSFQFWFFFNR